MIGQVGFHIVTLPTSDETIKSIDIKIDYKHDNGSEWNDISPIITAF